MPAPTSLAPVRDIFHAMRTEQINGHSLSDVVGGGDPELVALEVVEMIEEYAPLNLGDSILDVECGCGRIAAALTQYLNPKAHYIWIDIVPGLIDFARNFITPRYPYFKFLLLNKSNSSYDSWRRKAKNTHPVIPDSAGRLPPGAVEMRSEGKVADDRLAREV